MKSILYTARQNRVLQYPMSWFQVKLVTVVPCRTATLYNVNSYSVESFSTFYKAILPCRTLKFEHCIVFYEPSFVERSSILKSTVLWSQPRRTLKKSTLRGRPRRTLKKSILQSRFIQRWKNPFYEADSYNVDQRSTRPRRTLKKSILQGWIHRTDFFNVVRINVVRGPGVRI